MRVKFYTLHVPLKYSFLNVDRDLNGIVSRVGLHYSGASRDFYFFYLYHIMIRRR